MTSTTTSNLIFAFCLPATANAPTTRDGQPDNFRVHAFRSEEEYQQASDSIWTGRNGLNLVKDWTARKYVGNDAVVFESGEVMETGDYLDALYETEQGYRHEDPETRMPAYRIKRVYSNFQVLNWNRRDAEREATWVGNQR